MGPSVKTTTLKNGWPADTENTAHLVNNVAKTTTVPPSAVSLVPTAPLTDVVTTVGPLLEMVTSVCLTVPEPAQVELLTAPTDTPTALITDATCDQSDQKEIWSM